jgi:hypothetical protein
MILEAILSLLVLVQAESAQVSIQLIKSSDVVLQACVGEVAPLLWSFCI